MGILINFGGKFSLSLSAVRHFSYLINLSAIRMIMDLRTNSGGEGRNTSAVIALVCIWYSIQSHFLCNVHMCSGIT